MNYRFVVSEGSWTGAGASEVNHRSTELPAGTIISASNTGYCRLNEYLCRILYVVGIGHGAYIQTVGHQGLLCLV